VTSSFSDNFLGKNLAKIDFNGLRVFPALLSRLVQQQIVDEISQLVRVSPLYRPVMPKTGQPFSVRMMCLGELGWVSDKNGYRYQELHPVTGVVWPPITKRLNDIWDEVADYSKYPQSCIVNYYDGEAKMGLHKDRDEEDFEAPIVSISLGDTAIFRIGGLERNGPTRSLKLSSGDVVVLGGQSRLIYHGIDRVLSGSSTLLKKGGRLNLTLRRVTK